MACRVKMAYPSTRWHKPIVIQQVRLSIALKPLLATLLLRIRRRTYLSIKPILHPMSDLPRMTGPMSHLQ